MRCVALGDSITCGSSDHNAVIQGGNCYWNVLQFLSAARLVFVRNAGWPSQPTATIVNRFYDEVLPYLPDAMFLMEGTNDVGAMPSAGYDAPAKVALLNEAGCIRAALGSGIIPIVIAMPPRGIPSSPQIATSGYTKQLNDARAVQAKALGAIWIDVWTPLADPVNLWYSSDDLSGDGVHPNSAGAVVIASTILSAISSMLPISGSPRAITQSDTQSPFVNALFHSMDGVTPDTWTFYGGTYGKTQSIVTDSTVNGNWARVAWAAGSLGSGFAVLQSPYMPCPALRGKRVAFSGRLRTQGFPASGSTVGVKATFYDAAGANIIAPILGAVSAVDFSADSISGISGSGGAFYIEGYCPASAVTVQVAIQYVPGASGSGTVYADVAEFAMFIIHGREGFIDTRSGKSPRRINQVSAAYTVGFDDDLILVNASAGDVTISLPPVGANYYSTINPSYGVGLPGSGSQYKVIKTDGTANVVTVAAASGDNVQGSATVVLTTQWSTITVCAIDSHLWVEV